MRRKNTCQSRVLIVRTIRGEGSSVYQYDNLARYDPTITADEQHSPAKCSIFSLDEQHRHSKRLPSSKRSTSVAYGIVDGRYDTGKDKMKEANPNLLLSRAHPIDRRIDGFLCPFIHSFIHSPELVRVHDVEKLLRPERDGWLEVLPVELGRHGAPSLHALHVGQVAALRMGIGQYA